MKPASLIEIKPENKVHDLASLLSEKPEISIGRRDTKSGDGQADIILGEDNNGRLLFFPAVMRGISSRQAVITYEDGDYFLQDCSVDGTTRINDRRLVRGEKIALKTGANIYFGDNKYGPVIFVE
ncbi:MAG: FHA domain-containing protein [Nanoarchaeota archaeon]